MNNKIKNILKEIVYWTWCLPQTLVGLLVKIIYNAGKVTELNGEEFHLSCDIDGCISLGKYIILDKFDQVTYQHELGHQKQSFILGPLYLLVIGLPSIIWCNFFEGYRSKHDFDYYSFYTERWADKLSGVIRHE